MTDEASDQGANARRRPHFRNSHATRLPPDASARQGEITTLAFRLLGGRDAAIAFLNGHDLVLEGRPLDIAIASPEGFSRVERALADAAEARQR